MRASKETKKLVAPPIPKKIIPGPNNTALVVIFGSWDKSEPTLILFLFF